MENYRSKSCRDGRTKIGSFYGGRRGPISMHDLRSYSTNSYASSSVQVQAQATQIEIGKELKMKRSVKSSSVNGSASRSWSLNDPELQRKKRVASYKAYSVEGKMKGSLRKSFRWVKNTYTQVVYGWW